MEGTVRTADTEGPHDTEDMDKSTEHKTNDQPTHFLVRTDPVDGLMQPVQASTRFKYVCMAVSESCVAMGTNTGVVYVFSRISQRRIHVIPGEIDGAIVQITLNGQGNLLAYATGKGHVIICRLYPSAGGHPTRLRCAFEHVGSTVMAIHWNYNSDRLFIGDDLGRISVVNFFSLNNNALGSLGPPSEVILRLESPVVQLDSRGEQLLVSTKTKTVLCDIKKHQFSQIGKRSRDGKFGSCFFGPGSEEAAVIYCSRPGSRMWAVDCEGVVLNTHQFKHLLDKPPTPIFSLRDWSPADSVPRSSPGPQSLAFPKLLLCGGQYLLFCCPKGLYILDPVDVGLLNWTDQVTDAEDVCCYKSEVYVLRQSGDIDKLELLSVRDLWTCLVSRQQWDLAAWLVVNFPSLTMYQDKAYSIALPLLKELSTKVTASNTKTSLVSLIKGLEAEGATKVSGTEEPCYDRLDSGIYKIRTQNRETKLLQTSVHEPCLETAEKTSVKSTSPLPDTPDKEVLVEEQPNTVSGDLTNGHGVSRVIGDDHSGEAHLSNPLSCGQDTDTTQRLEGHAPQPTPIVVDAITSSTAQTSNIPEENDDTAINSFMHDPAPVYLSSGETRKVKGRKVKPASVGLDPSSKKQAEKDKKSKRSKAHGPVKTTNSVKPHEVLKEWPENKNTGNREEHSHSPDSVKESSPGTVPEVDSTNSVKECADIPVIHQQFVDGVEPEVQTPRVGQPEIPRHCEDLVDIATPDIDASGTPAPETSLDDVDEKVTPSTRINFYSVKERISSKVKSTTLSMIQNIKDKKVQLTRIVSSPEDKDPGCIDNMHVEDQVSKPSYSQELSSEPAQDACAKGKAESETGLSVIDVKDLVLATENCRAKMDDPQILYRPDVAKAALASWAMLLNHNLHTLLFVSQDKETTTSGSNTTIPDEETEKMEDKPTNLDEKLGVSIQQKSYVETKLEMDISADLAGDDTTNSCGEDANRRDQEVMPVDATSGEGISLEGQLDKNSDGDLVQPQCSDDEASSSVDTDTCRLTNPAPVVFHDVRDFEKLMFTQDPFNLPADCHQAASELAQLCLSFNCYGGTSELINISRELPECDIQIVQNDINCINIGSTPKETNPTYLVPNHACEDQYTEDEPEDELSTFLRCHFHLFEGHLDETHRAVLRQCKYRFERWQSFASCLLDLTADDVVTHQIMDTDVEAAIDFLRSQVSQRGIWVLASILRLYGMVPQRTLAFCAEIWEHVPPIDIFFLTKMASKLDTHFLLYTQRILDKHTNPNWMQALRVLCKDEEVKQGLMDSLLKARPETTIPISCQCGLPWPGAHLHQWPHEDLLHLVLDQGTCGVVERQLCWRHGFWSGVIKLCHREMNCTACREGHCDLHQMTYCDVCRNKPGGLDTQNVKCTHEDMHNSTSSSRDIYIEGPQRDINRHSDLQKDIDIDADSDAQTGKLRNPHGGKDWDMNRDTLQTIVLQLADINLLQQNTESGYFPESVTEWEQLLHKRSAQGYEKSGEAGYIDNSVLCLGCSRSLVTDATITQQPNATITESQNTDSYILDMPLRNTYLEDDVICSCRPDMTWEALAVMLVQEVGLSRGLGVLQGVGVPQGELPMSFFSSCVMAASLQNYQSRLVHNMLERVDTYLWSVRPTTMAPEISMAVLQENSDSGHTASTDKMFEQLRGEPILSSSLEDATAGWGVTADLTGNCCACALPFKTMVSPLHTGTIFFKCGHGFHYACSSRTSCSTCLSSRPVLLP